METHDVFWKVSLSNGETLYENKGDYKRIDDLLPPWERLMLYICDNNLEITSLNLYTDSGRTFHLPSSGKNPKFKIFATEIKPLFFDFSRNFEIEIRPKVSTRTLTTYSIAWAVYPEFILQLWVKNGDHDTSWVTILPKSTPKV